MSASPRSEAVWFALAIGAVGLHILDDNFLQPARGTSPFDHLASGLVPIAILVAVAAVYRRLHPGARAAIAMTLGAIAITFGTPGVYYLLSGTASGDHYSGLLSIAAGVVLLAIGPVTLWKARRMDGSRRHRYLRRGAAIAVAPFLALAAIWFLVFPIGFAYIYTHTGKGIVTPELGVPHEQVALPTSDSLELAAFYVPSRNHAAVVLFPGATHPEQARMLIRHGYGVLLLDPRGQGRSEGDTVRWAGDRDLLAAVNYLRGRPDVDPGRIGGFGFSIGGEMLLEAAAQSDGFKAVISEGAGSRVGEEDVSGPARLLAAPNLAVMTAALAVFSNHGPPPPIVNRIGRIAPRSVFLIYAEHGIGGENLRQPKYYAAAGRPKAIWKVPGANHTGGIEARPAEYEQRVIGFFDRSLLQTKEPTAKGRPMIDFTVETEIARPVSEVFAHVTDPSKLATWQASTVSATTEDDGPLGLGTRLREVHRAPGGKEFASRVEVSEYEPDRVFALHVLEGALALDARIIFESTENGTQLRLRVHGQPTGAMRLAQPLLRRSLRRQFARDCARLKQVLESASTASASVS